MACRISSGALCIAWAWASSSPTWTRASSAFSVFRLMSQRISSSRTTASPTTSPPSVSVALISDQTSSAAVATSKDRRSTPSSRPPAEMTRFTS